MFGIGKISLGSSAHKRYNHNLSFDNNTTFEFGAIQPLMCQYMMPNSDIKASYKQLVRLAPMVSPSFARVHLQNEVSFVSIAEVVPYYEAMLARQSYSVGSKTYKPTQLPSTSNSYLVYLLLTLFKVPYTYWEKFSDSPYTVKPVAVSAANAGTVYGKLQKLFFGSEAASGTVPVLQPTSNIYNTDVNQCITFTGADYVVKFSDGSAITFRLNASASRVRKIFIGLGYSLNMTDNTAVSIVPLLAFYKAWFDLYAVQREANWLSTDCYALIKYIEDNYSYFFYRVGAVAPDAPAADLFHKLLLDFANCWYIYKDDYVSVHRSSVQLSQSSVKFIQNGSYQTLQNFATSAGPIDPVLSSSGLVNVGLQTLQRLSRFVNKDSIIGKRMSQWLRVHYGADVANSLFKDVNHISSSRLDLQINDVFSTSDTADANTEQGEVLGAYAGKGMGFDENGFKFHASTAGYIFVLSAIVPESGYFQGNDPTLYAINNDTIPNADYDALGFEVTPKGVIASDNDIYIQNTSENLSDKSFGFIPRFSGFKIKKNIVNGDMSKRSTIDSFSSYYLDRILTSNVLMDEKFGGESRSTDIIDLRSYPLPVASTQWRYCCRYPWLGNYNRLFYSQGTLYKGGDFAQDYDSKDLLNDNFICQCLFTVSVTNTLKPISESYDTYEESTDKGTVNVVPE